MLDTLVVVAVELAAMVAAGSSALEPADTEADNIVEAAGPVSYTQAAVVVLDRSNAEVHPTLLDPHQNQ